MDELVVVRYLQPAQSLGITPPKLDGLYNHPDRYVFCMCWFDGKYIQGVGRQGRFKVDENLKCEDYLGKYQAEIVQRNIDQDRCGEGDWYTLA